MKIDIPGDESRCEREDACTHSWAPHIDAYLDNAKEMRLKAAALPAGTV